MQQRSGQTGSRCRRTRSHPRPPARWPYGAEGSSTGWHWAARSGPCHAGRRCAVGALVSAPAASCSTARVSLP
eukprot:13500533-Heterocapsa_arctica.AAC.1